LIALFFLHDGFFFYWDIGNIIYSKYIVNIYFIYFLFGTLTLRAREKFLLFEITAIIYNLAGNQLTIEHKISRKNFVLDRTGMIFYVGCGLIFLN